MSYYSAITALAVDIQARMHGCEYTCSMKPTFMLDRKVMVAPMINECRTRTSMSLSRSQFIFSMDCDSIRYRVAEGPTDILYLSDYVDGLGHERGNDGRVNCRLQSRRNWHVHHLAITDCLRDDQKTHHNPPYHVLQDLLSRRFLYLRQPVKHRRELLVRLRFLVH